MSGDDSIQQDLFEEIFDGGLKVSAQYQLQDDAYPASYQNDRIKKDVTLRITDQFKGDLYRDLVFAGSGEVVCEIVNLDVTKFDDGQMVVAYAVCEFDTTK